MTGLAWILIAHDSPRTRDPSEALRLATRAVEIAGEESATPHYVLAAIQEATGDPERARETARRAVTIARGTGQSDIASMATELMLRQTPTARAASGTARPARPTRAR